MTGTTDIGDPAMVVILTPEMIAAGIAAMNASLSQYEAVSSIYAAMERARYDALKRSMAQTFEIAGSHKLILDDFIAHASPPVPLTAKQWRQARELMRAKFEQYDRDMAEQNRK